MLLKVTGKAGNDLPQKVGGYLCNRKAGFSHEQGQPLATSVGGLLLRFSFINVSYNQWASRIVTLTFLTKSVNNEFTSLVQKTHPHRAFLRNHTKTNFICSRTYRTVNLCSKLVLIIRLVLYLYLVRSIATSATSRNSFYFQL